MLQAQVLIDTNVAAAIAHAAKRDELIGLENRWRWEYRDEKGRLKWEDEYDNLITTAGKNDILTKYFAGSSYTAAWYVGLTAGAPTFAAGDTMASHSGWTEVVAYTQSTRVAYTIGTVSAGSGDNSGSAAAFSINAGSTTVGGGFLVTVSTKSGTTGTLYGGGAFTQSDQVLGSGGTLTATITVTAS